MKVKAIENQAEALQIAQIRNTGVDNMTHDTQHIWPSEQVRWYRQTYGPANEQGAMTAYIGHELYMPVAYGMIKNDEDSSWLTGVVTPDAQGKGYGRQLFEHLVAEAPQRVMLDVLNTNERAIILYKSLGFTAIETDGRVTVMVLKDE
jgi:ribosomal protein S18 acetylase RimI-like enzyme